MSKFFENKRNQIILGTVAGIILVAAIVLILTGKINLRSIMGNTAQGNYTCPEGQGYTLNEKTKKCEREVVVGTATKRCSNGADPTNNCKVTKKYVGSKECPSDSTPGTGDTCYVTKVLSTPTCPTGYTLQGSQCVANVPTYTCPDGYDKKINGYAATCTKQVPYCPDKYGDFGKYRVELVNNQSLCKYYGKSCRLGPGGNPNGSYCVKAATQTSDCGTGWNKRHTGSGWECYTSPKEVFQASEYPSKKTETTTPISTIDKKTPSCSSGTFEAGKCVSRTYVQKVTTCKNGGDPSGNNCYIISYGTVKYSCPNGGTPSGTNCIKSESIDATFIKQEVIEETKIICNVGYEEKDGQCVKKEETTPTTCPEGQELKDGECVVKQEATPTTCPEGQELKDGECVVKQEATLITCPEGQELKDGECVKIEKEKINITSSRNAWPLNTDFTNSKNAISVMATPGKSEVTINCSISDPKIAKLNKTTYTFKESVNLNVTGLEVGKTTIKCTTTDNNSSSYDLELKEETTKPSTDDTKIEAVKPSEIIDTLSQCPEGYTPSGSVCIKKETIQATVKYSCANGYTLKDNKCEKTETKEPTSTFKCPTGYSKSDNTCYRIDEINASISYTCPIEYTLNTTTRKCEKVATVPLVQNNYTCPDDYELLIDAQGNASCVTAVVITNTNSCAYNYSNGICWTYDKIDLTAKNTCPTGYELSGNICTGKTIMPSIMKYSCSTGYTLNSKTCTKKITQTVDTNKYCPNGYTLKNDKCQTTVTVAAEATYSCPIEYTISGTNCTRTLTSNLISN